MKNSFTTGTVKAQRKKTQMCQKSLDPSANLAAYVQTVQSVGSVFRIRPINKLAVKAE